MDKMDACFGGQHGTNRGDVTKMEPSSCTHLIDMALEIATLIKADPRISCRGRDPDVSVANTDGRYVCCVIFRGANEYFDFVVV
jgi:hypothetical protein